MSHQHTHLRHIDQRDFVKSFNALCAGSHSRWEVWSDFIQFAAIAISNAVDLSNREDREKTYNHRTEKQIDWLYSNMNLSEMRRSAERLLSDFGRSINYPLVTERTKMANYSRRVTARINACNIIPGLMMVPIPKEHYEGTDTFRWAVIDGVNHKEHHGPVYSLAVAKFHHYIADGIVTHNCLYGWTDGGSHYWGSDRKQTTVMEFDKPRASKEHPTMKPIPLFDYQIRNSAAMGERCLDLFGGSGTTIMACEQNKRIAYVMEYDPKYVDVIIKRWEEFTGQKAELINE